MKARIILALTLSATSVACSDDLVEMQTIQGLRVLGARVESADDPALAEPEPGSRVHLSWLVVSERLESFEARLQVCESAPVTRAIGQCEGRPFFETTSSADTSDDLGFDFDLPKLAPGSEWLAKLALCSEGTPSFDSQGEGRCSGRSRVFEALTTARVRDGASNQNPDLSDDELTLAGKDWTQASELLPGDDCDADSGLLRLKAGVQAQVAFELGGDDRERLPEELSQRYGSAGKEGLLFAHFMTAKGLARPLSNIDAASREPSFDVDVELDEKESFGSGTVVEFALVVRDDRGGTDWLRRKLCARSR